jgi:hypothetical protein
MSSLPSQPNTSGGSDAASNTSPGTGPALAPTPNPIPKPPPQPWPHADAYDERKFFYFKRGPPLSVGP